MPLGGFSKAEVRALAKEFGFKVHDKDESQDICFVPENDYAAFLKTHLGQNDFHPGEVVHQDGRVLGKHPGIELFTIGQRKGINVGNPKPLYVLEIDPKSRKVIVGDDEELWHEGFEANRSCWGVRGPLPDGTKVTVKIRHSHEGAAATLHPLENGKVRVALKSPQRAITPGQATVFYDGDEVVGGAWIEKKL